MAGRGSAGSGWAGTGPADVAEAAKVDEAVNQAGSPCEVAAYADACVNGYSFDMATVRLDLRIEIFHSLRLSQINGDFRDLVPDTRSLCAAVEIAVSSAAIKIEPIIGKLPS